MLPQGEKRQRNDLLDAALEALGRGLPVIPVCAPAMGRHSHDGKRCAKAGKTPLVKWKAFQQQLPTEADVRRWWRTWPAANVGFITGRLSGVIVVDLDGAEALALAEQLGLPDGPTLLSGRVGGRHRWYRHPGGDVRVSSANGVYPNVDVKADGGYAILPPSVHHTGKPYQWADGTEALPLLPAPQWVTARPARAASAHQDREPDAPIAEGARNSELTRIAGFARRAGCTAGEIEALLSAVNARRCVPPLDDDEVAGIARSVSRYPAGEPPKPSGSAGAATCDGSCPTGTALRERVGEYKAADRLRTAGPFSPGTAAVLQHLIDQTFIIRSNGQGKGALFRPTVAAASGISLKGVSRAFADLEQLQADPSVKATLPVLISRRTDASGKDHIDLVVPAVETAPTRREMLDAAMLAPRLKAAHGGKRTSAPLPPDNPDCPWCRQPMTTHRSRVDICPADDCGRVVTYPTRTKVAAVLPRASCEAAGPVRSDPPGHLDPSRYYRTEGGHLDQGPHQEAPRSDWPVSFVTPDQHLTQALLEQSSHGAAAG